MGAIVLTVPLHDGDGSYPGGIAPGCYTMNEVVAMLRRHKHDPAAVQFIADMLEE